MEMKDLITSGACESTIAGWVWYCDEHMTHGNADSAGEAEHIANAHSNWYADASYQAYLLEEEPDEDEENEEEFDPENWSGCDVYLINVGINKTFSIGENYEDETPNVITDLEQAQAIRKQLGLP
jgi:hypothetical protein